MCYQWLDPLQTFFKQKTRNAYVLKLLEAQFRCSILGADPLIPFPLLLIKAQCQDYWRNQRMKWANAVPPPTPAMPPQQVSAPSPTKVLLLQEMQKIQKMQQRLLKTAQFQIDLLDSDDEESNAPSNNPVQTLKKETTVNRKPVSSGKATLKTVGKAPKTVEKSPKTFEKATPKTVVEKATPKPKVSLAPKPNEEIDMESSEEEKFTSDILDCMIAEGDFLLIRYLCFFFW